MMSEPQNLPLADELQPPMANGEVLFAEPWQGRVFGMAITLHEAGVFTWPDFQAELIKVIAGWDADHQEVEGETDEYRYYEHFQTALHQVLSNQGVVSVEALAERSDSFARRPHGHDHH